MNAKNPAKLQGILKIQKIEASKEKVEKFCI